MNSKHLRRAGAILAAGAVAGIATLSAHATQVVPFSCITGGAAINADGSSFQNAGVQAQISAYATACPGNGTVTYTSTGSGKGITDFIAGAVQFAGTDVPYTDAQWATMHTKSHLETVPIALGAVGVPVNLACMNNFQVSGATLGQIYAGKLTNWTQVNPACPSTAITAFHRSGGSGTTTAFKTYLTKKDAADFGAGCAGSTCYKDSTTNWPAPGTSCTAANTNQAMVNCVLGTVGAVGYIDEADVANSSALDADLVQVDNAALAFSTPQPGQCTAAAQTNVTPTHTSADWSQVDVTDGPNGYGICTYTYQLAYDLPVTAGVATAAQAALIANFIQYEVSDAGQTVFQQNHYDLLPTQVQAAAQLGAQQLTTH